MSIIYPGTGRTYENDPVIRIPKVPATKPTLGNNPGLITSTGGLQGFTGVLLTPVVQSTTDKNLIVYHDPLSYDCEDSSEYNYRQEANFGQIPGEGRSASFHLIILKYRELGNAKFSINITVFNQAIDAFETIQIPVTVPVIPLSKMSSDRKRAFPDRRIHTVKITPPKGVITGERPQVSITRKGGSGPLAITKLVLCGNADEVSEL